MKRNTKKGLAHYRVILTIIISLLVFSAAKNAHAYYFHYVGGYKHSMVVWRGQFTATSVDIVLDGISSPDIFSDVVLFQPSEYFIDLTTPDKSILHIDFTPPINYDPLIPELDISTFTTIIDWGDPGPSPFTFIEYNENGEIIGQGSIVNVVPEPSTGFLFGFGLLTFLAFLQTKTVSLFYKRSMKKA